LSYDILLAEKSEDYLEFKKDITDRNQIRELIDNCTEVKVTIGKHKEKLLEWWQVVRTQIEQFYGKNNLWKFRNEALEKLKNSLLPIGTFDEFKIAGIFANWWEELVYDFKSIVSADWNKNLVERERIKEKYFKKDIEEIEDLESRLAEIEADLSELLEEVEDWDEEQQGDKTASKVKEFLKDLVKDLKSKDSEAARREARKWEDLLENIVQKEKEIKNVKSEIGRKQKELENKIDEKIESITKEEAKELLIEKFFELISNQLEKYLNAEKKELIKIFEKLWDKYHVSLEHLLKEREQEVSRLSKFLEELGYYERV